MKEYMYLIGDKMKNKSGITIIILAIITIAVVLITYFIDNNKKEEGNDINIVANYSKFFTVNSCIFRSATYISSKDSDSLLKVLSEEYKRKNNITSENVLTVFDSIDENSTFESRKMYMQQYKKNIVKYYVYGILTDNKLMQNSSLTKEETKDMYFIVYLDTENEIFSIQPYDGKIFIDGLDGENNEG